MEPAEAALELGQRTRIEQIESNRRDRGNEVADMMTGSRIGDLAGKGDLEAKKGEKMSTFFPGKALIFRFVLGFLSYPSIAPGTC